jgi:hypothetical protein
MNPVSSPLLNAHVVGDNALTVDDPTVFSPVFPFNVVAEQVKTQQFARFTVLSLSGNTFTVTPLAGYGDIALDAETQIEEATPNESLKVLQGLALQTFDSFGRPISQGGAPTIAAGAAAGTSPSGVNVSAWSNDIVGQINFTTGSSPTTTGVIATVTFNKTWVTAPKNVILSPANAAAVAAMADLFVSSITTTTFVISASGSALTGATALAFRYTTQG